MTGGISENVDKQSATAFPQIGNRPEDIFAWTALEVLSPPVFVRRWDLAGGDKSRVVDLFEGGMPWKRGERSRPNQRMYYQIVLGSIKMEPAIEALLNKYGDDRPEGPLGRGMAVLAVAIVDSGGRLVKPPAAGLFRDLDQRLP